MLITWEQAKFISLQRFPATVYPIVEFAQNYQNQATMPPAIVHIRYSLALRLQNALIRKDTTYRIWCTENNVPLADLAIEWKATKGDTCFAFVDMAWNPAVLQKECNLSDEAKLPRRRSRVVCQGTLSTTSTVCFSGGPQTAEQLSGLSSRRSRSPDGDLNQHLGYKAQLVDNIYELRLWIYSTEVNVSGLLADAQSQQDMKMTAYVERHQRELRMTPGFLFPSQVATLMQCETEDLMLYAAPAFTCLWFGDRQ